ncbi:MAG: HAD family phosphatase [Sphingobium sp.]|nr:HAD family phosphatase [Sphingobium sp.]MBP9156518.1 HAD family phosphatase [Sphingobium sp.]
MDGVLIEAKDWHYEALNKALALFGMSISRYDHLNTYDGLPTRKKLEMLSAERGLPKELHKFINEMKQKFTIDIIHSHCKPQFIQEYALSSLKAKGYSMAVCSNSVRGSVEAMMNRAGLEPYLDLMISNEDVIAGKPDPEMYIKAIKHFGLTPQQCLIVEDNEHGIKAARASGAHLLVVREVQDTNLENILGAINKAEADNSKVEVAA